MYIFCTSQAEGTLANADKPFPYTLAHMQATAEIEETSFLRLVRELVSEHEREVARLCEENQKLQLRLDADSIPVPA